MKYDHDMIRTIARCFYMVPGDYTHMGYDWPPNQLKWESMSEEEKAPWYNKAESWLDILKEAMPDAFSTYMKYWMPDAGKSNHLFLPTIPHFVEGVLNHSSSQITK